MQTFGAGQCTVLTWNYALQGKNHEIINEGAECVVGKSEAVFAPP